MSIVQTGGVFWKSLWIAIIRWLQSPWITDQILSGNWEQLDGNTVQDIRESQANVSIYKKESTSHTNLKMHLPTVPWTSGRCSLWWAVLPCTVWLSVYWFFAGYSFVLWLCSCAIVWTWHAAHWSIPHWCPVQPIGSSESGPTHTAATHGGAKAPSVDRSVLASQWQILDSWHTKLPNTCFSFSFLILWKLIALLGIDTSEMAVSYT